MWKVVVNILLSSNNFRRLEMSKRDEAILKIIPMMEVYSKLLPEEKDVKVYKNHLINYSKLLLH